MEEMAVQKQYSHQENAHGSGGADLDQLASSRLSLMREKGIMAVMPSIRQKETDDRRADRHLMRSYVAWILCKTFISNMLMLYLMSQFYALKSDQLTLQGRAKLLGGMSISVYSAFMRCKQVVHKFQGPGVPIAIMVLALVTLSVRSVIMSHRCPSGSWSATKGCSEV